MVKYGPHEPAQSTSEKLAKFQRSQDGGSGRSMHCTQPASSLDDHKGTAQHSESASKTPKIVHPGGTYPSKVPWGSEERTGEDMEGGQGPLH